MTLLEDDSYVSTKVILERPCQLRLNGSEIVQCKTIPLFGFFVQFLFPQHGFEFVQFADFTNIKKPINLDHFRHFFSCQFLI